MFLWVWGRERKSRREKEKNLEHEELKEKMLGFEVTAYMGFSPQDKKCWVDLGGPSAVPFLPHCWLPGVTLSRERCRRGPRGLGHHLP